MNKASKSKSKILFSSSLEPTSKTKNRFNPLRIAAQICLCSAKHEENVLPSIHEPLLNFRIVK